MPVRIPPDLLVTEEWNQITTSVPDNDAPTDSGDYWTGYDMVDENGTIISRLAADAAHNHVGFYTRKHPLDDPSGKRIKRLNIEGGTFTDDGEVETEIRAFSPGDTRLSLSANRSPILELGNNQNRAVIYLDRGRNQLRIGDLTDHSGILDIRLSDNAFDFRGNPLTGLREIPDPEPSDLLSREWAWDKTGDRWLFKSSDGEVHWFRPCGTL